MSSLSGFSRGASAEPGDLLSGAMPKHDIQATEFLEVRGVYDQSR